jgi:hypothetical protein
MAAEITIASYSREAAIGNGYFMTTPTSTATQVPIRQQGKKYTVSQVEASANLPIKDPQITNFANV